MSRVSGGVFCRLVTRKWTEARKTGATVVRFWNTNLPSTGGSCLIAMVLAVAITGCKQDVPLSKVPPAGPSPVQPVRRELTTIQLGIPIDLASAVARADAVIPSSFGRIIDWIDDAACARRTKGIQCTTARVDIDIRREQPVTIAVTNGRVEIAVQLQYEINARGLGWARDITDQQSGELTAIIPLETTVNPDFTTTVRLKDPVAVTGGMLSVFKGKVSLAKHLDGRLKKPLTPVLAALGESMGTPSLKETAERAWRAVGTPVELMREPQLWLRVEPERLLGAGLASVDGHAFYQLRIGARIGIVSGQRPAPMLPRALPTVTELAPNDPLASETRSELRLPVVVDAGPMLAGIKSAFPAAEILKSAPNRTAEPVSTKVRTVAIYPSRGQVGIELQLDLLGPAKWSGRIGTAHFLGKPVLQPNGILELENLALADNKHSQTRTAQKPAVSAPGLAPRIGDEPFVSRIARTARLDLTGTLRDLLPHANALVNQPLGGGFSLAGRMDQVTVASIEPVRDGFEIVFAIKGQLMMRYDATVATVTPTEPMPATR